MNKISERDTHYSKFQLGIREVCIHIATRSLRNISIQLLLTLETHRPDFRTIEILFFLVKFKTATRILGICFDRLFVSFRFVVV